jgi:cytochrome c-type biogenesis protein
MGAFALGRGIPLVLAGLWAGAVKGMRELSRFAPAVERVVGLLLLGGAAYFAWQLSLML